MHGRPRPPKGFKPPEELLQKVEKKTRVLKSATDEVLKRIKDRNHDEQTFKMSAKLIKLNPEIYTVWNYRRDALNLLFEEKKEMSLDEKARIVLSELEIVTEALASNPKSYGSWHHRCWVTSLGLSSLQQEFNFVEKKLEEDSRNFHAWNYRHYLVKTSGRSPEQELVFSKEKIEQNFSNYSAWHHRSHCLRDVYEHVPVVAFTDLVASSETKKKTSKSFLIPISVLQEELEMVHSAFVTDPEDSSAWLYYRWVIGNILHLGQESADELKKIEQLLASERKLFESEILPLDPASKWILLTYVLLLEVEAEVEKKAKSEQILETYDKLMEVDSMRKGFYKDVKNGKASILVKSTSL